VSSMLVSAMSLFSKSCANFASALDTVSPDTLWALLTPAERSKFEKALRDSDGSLAKHLLASAEIEKDLTSPWWEAPRVSPPTNQKTIQGIEASHNPVAKQYGAPPKMMPIPPQLLAPSTTAKTSLLYNIVAVWYVLILSSPKESYQTLLQPSVRVRDANVIDFSALYSPSWEPGGNGRQKADRQNNSVRC
jgi:hypothetical protein